MTALLVAISSVVGYGIGRAIGFLIKVAIVIGALLYLSGEFVIGDMSFVAPKDAYTVEQQINTQSGLIVPTVDTRQY